MIATRNFLLTAVAIAALNLNSLAQWTVGAGMEYPNQFQVQGAWNPTGGHQLFAQIGYFGGPMSRWFFNDLEQNGTDTTTVEILRQSYRNGWLFSGGYRYEYRGFYADAYTQFIDLNAADSDIDLLLTYYDAEALKPLIELISIPTLIPTSTRLSSGLWQAGVRAGYRFAFDDHWGVSADVGYSANLHSRSRLQTRLDFIEDVKAIKEEYEANLFDTYSNGAYFFTIGVQISYRWAR